MSLKVALVVLHLVYAGVLFLFDGGLIEKAQEEPWYVNFALGLAKELAFVRVMSWWKQ